VLNPGFIVFAHGSSIESANQSVRRVAEQFAGRGEGLLVEPAFLEAAEPDLEGAVSRLVARGADGIRVLPYFLTLGVHLQRDLPRLVEEISRRRHGLPISVAPPLDGHPALTQILVDRAVEATG
jgi:sirohydrochlorin ferrochelatase